MLALVVAMVLSPLPYSAIAIGLFLLQLYLIWEKPATNVSLPLNLLCLIALPLTLDSIIPLHLAALFVLPLIPLLDYELKGNAKSQPLTPFAQGRKVSIVLQGMLISLGLVLLFSLIVASYTLSLTTAFLLAYIAFISVYTLRRLSYPLRQEGSVELKVVAGEDRGFAIDLRNESGMPLRLRLKSLYPWVRLKASEFEVAERLSIEASVEPPLAGPASISLQISALDQRGLLQANRVMELAKLTVIPRATYAAWLARRYLEEGAGALRGTALAITPLSERKGRGVEYHSSHLYSPGDSWKDMDWKHTARLRELIVKKYLDMPAQVAVVVVNLATEDAEEADRMAYSLMTSVLALAVNSIPMALAAYNQWEVVEATPLTAPNVMLRKVLQLIEETVWLEPAVRFLQPPDLRRLGRTQKGLEGVDSEPAQRLAAILGMEREAVRRATAQHPAALALRQATSFVAPPAMIIAISCYNHDAETLSVTLSRLEDRGYRVLPGYVKGRSPQRMANAELRHRWA
jgi:hypothetical protein